MLHLDAVPKPVLSLLTDLAGHPALAGFALGGGTSLALRFGHRLSVDLDFFTTDGFDPGELAVALAIRGAVQVNRARNTLSMAANGVKLDFLRHDYARLAAVEIVDGISMLSLADVAAMKLNALANRGAKKDFFDVVALCSRLPLVGMLDWFEQKYPDADRFTVIRSLGWFDDAEAEPDPVSLTGQSWQDVKAAISRLVAELR